MFTIFEEKPDWEGLNIMYNVSHGKVASEDSSSTSSVTTIEIPFIEKFKKLVVNNSLIVHKETSKAKFHFRYYDGFFVLKSFFRKKIICVKGLRSCTRVNYTIVLETIEHGFLILKINKLEDAMVLENIIPTIMSGSYDHGS